MSKIFKILLPLIFAISTCIAFSAKQDAEKLKTAMAPWFKNDEDTIINILCKRTYKQRREIFDFYRKLYGKDLISELKSELSGSLETLLTLLMEVPAKRDARYLYDAMHGKGTADNTLIEIIVSRTNQQLEDIKTEFENLYTHTLEHFLHDDTSGDFRTIIMSLAAGNRDESTETDKIQARDDAISLYRFGGLEYSKILCSRNFLQLRLIFEDFKKIANKTIEDTLSTTFNNHDSTIEQLVQFVRSRSKYFKQQLERSISLVGTEDMLIRIFVSQETHLKAIGEQFGGKNSFEYFIKTKTQGNLNKALLTLVRFWWDL